MKYQSADEPPKDAPTLNLSQIFRERLDAMEEQMRELKRKQKSTLSTDQNAKNKR
jgi:hypothetical protein